jgi:hypothetical protein
MLGGAVRARLEQIREPVGAHLVVDLSGVRGVQRRLYLADRRAGIEDGDVDPEVWGVVGLSGRGGGRPRQRDGGGEHDADRGGDDLAGTMNEHALVVPLCGFGAVR